MTEHGMDVARLLEALLELEQAFANWRDRHEIDRRSLNMNITHNLALPDAAATPLLEIVRERLEEKANRKLLTDGT